MSLCLLVGLSDIFIRSSAFSICLSCERAPKCLVSSMSTFDVLGGRNYAGSTLRTLWLQWLQWGVTFSQVVWLIGC